MTPYHFLQESNSVSDRHHFASRSRGKLSVYKSGKGYTLIELIIAVGLFALVMTLASGAYLLMISISRQTQSVATGIDNLSFAAETMTRTIRTGADYSCGGAGGGDCSGGGSSLSVTNPSGATMTYALSGGAITQNGSPLTDPLVNITSLMFYVEGTAPAPSDYEQPHATISISGTITSGPGKTESFTLQTGATMRGTDI